jgi:lipoate-protein ligase A
MNINDAHPCLSKEIIFKAIEKEFLLLQNFTDCHKIYVEESFLDESCEVKELYMKYNSWDWKFGNTPEFINTVKYQVGLEVCFEIEFQVDRGLIQGVKIPVDNIANKFVNNVNRTLSKKINENVKYAKNDVKSLLSSLCLINMIDSQEITKAINSISDMI